MPVSDLNNIVSFRYFIILPLDPLIQLLLEVIILNGFRLVTKHIESILLQCELSVFLSDTQREHIVAHVVFIHNHLEQDVEGAVEIAVHQVVNLAAYLCSKHTIANCQL